MRASSLRLRRLAAIILICGMVAAPAAPAGAALAPAGSARAAAGRQAALAATVRLPALAAPGPAAIEITADQFGRPLAGDDAARLYDKPSVLLKAGDHVQFSAAVPADGDYTLSFDMAAGAFINRPEGQLLIDGAVPVEQPQHLVFLVYYQNSSEEFPLDRYGNEGLIRQQPLVFWTTAPARDPARIEKYPVQYHLSAGEHQFEFELTEESLYLGSVYLELFAPPPSYDQYRQAQTAPPAAGVLRTLEAESPAYKNDTSVRPVSSRSLEVTPYDTYRLLLNTLGGDSWTLSGSAVFYDIDVPADGLYAITLRA
ncbi:MAG: ABC transporter substrate-binding protein, partial [Anaerolineales bacterium]